MKVCAARYGNVDIGNRRSIRKVIQNMNIWMENIQVDIKYVPPECIRFLTYRCRYYQITGIDEYSRKRALKIVKERSTYETTKYIRELEELMGFSIRTIQVDNGSEFVNDDDKTTKDSAFEKAVNELGMNLRRTRPYSPLQQNGKEERSRREDGKILYGRKVFTSEKELKQKDKKHEIRYNKTAKTVLNFRSPD